MLGRDTIQFNSFMFKSYSFNCETQYRADSRFVASQWEMALLCNDVSHWMAGSLESVL